MTGGFGAVPEELGRTANSIGGDLRTAAMDDSFEEFTVYDGGPRR